MGDRDPIWDALKEHSKAKFDADRAKALTEAPDDGCWTKHTPYHWSRMIDGDRLDYWPSRSKWQFRGKVRRGNILNFKAVRPHEWTTSAKEPRP
jgi:hypothetical protein